jgi:hypothetical protein
MRKFNVVIFGKLPGKIPYFFFWTTKNVTSQSLGRKIHKSLYNAQKGNYSDKMSCDSFANEIFFNFAKKNIRYPPISQYKGNFFVYLQEGILNVFLL